MRVKLIISEILTVLTAEFGSLDDWFEVEEALLAYRPASSSWTVAEILEHVKLTNYYLLILIRKAAEKAQNGRDNMEGRETDLSRLERIGIHESFPWHRPEHMEPSGEANLDEVRAELLAQKEECLEILMRLRRGEGGHYGIRMSVDGLGRLNAYEWIYFLAMHIRRHRMQMSNHASSFGLDLEFSFEAMASERLRALALRSIEHEN